MRCFLVIILFCALCPYASAQEATWDRDELQSRNAVRLSELLRTLHPLHSWSTDRYTLRFIGSGLSGLHGEGPTILVDGMSMPFFFLDRSITEFIPVSPSDISKIEYTPEITILPQGRLADGMVSIRTDKPQGFLLRGSAAVVNETGDPGPAIYADSTLSNVDRSGPVANLRMSYGRRPFFVQAGLNTDLYHLTDEVTSGRMWRVYGEEKQPVVTIFAPHVRLLLETSRVEIHIRGGSAHKKDHLFSEFAGWEWPNRQRWTWLKTSSLINTSSRNRVGVRASFDRFEIQNRTAIISLPGELQLRESSGELFVEHSIGAAILEIAGGGRINEVDQISTFGSHRESAVFARFSLSVSASRTRWTTTGELSHTSGPFSDDDSRTINLASALSRSLDNGAQIRINAHYSGGVRRNLWSMRELLSLGVSFGEWADDVSFNTDRTSENIYEAGFELTYPLSEVLSFQAGLNVRYASGLTLPDRIITQRFGVGPFIPSTSYISGRAGWVVSRSLGVFFRHSLSTSSRLSYQFYHVSSNGDSVFWRHFTGFPRHRFSASISSHAFERLTFFGALRITSRMQWPEYITSDTGEITTTVEFEGTVRKSLFGPRIQVGISFLNLADARVRTHPAGVIQQFAVRLSLRIMLAAPENPS